MKGKFPAKKYHSIFISPHIDDAIFSCGGTVTLLSKKERVLIIYIFSDHGETTSLRKQEEEKIAQSLGYDYLFLDYPDFPERVCLGFLPHRLFRPFRKKKDQKWLDQILSELKRTLAPLEYNQIFFPLGVGMHLDHEICFRAGILQSYSNKVLFYEDLPYALAPGLLQKRLTSLGTEIDFPQQESLDSLLTYLFSRPFLGRRSFKRMERPLKYLLKPLLKRQFERVEKEEFNFNLNPSFICIEDTFDLKIESIHHYQSQIPHFFCSSEEMKEHYKKFHSMTDSLSLYERFWVLNLCSAKE